MQRYQNVILILFGTFINCISHVNRFVKCWIVKHALTSMLNAWFPKKLTSTWHEAIRPGDRAGRTINRTCTLYLANNSWAISCPVHDEAHSHRCKAHGLHSKAPLIPPPISFISKSWDKHLSTIVHILFNLFAKSGQKIRTKIISCLHLIVNWYFPHGKQRD